jgi:uncharacterized protein (DUF2147 family)
MNMHQSLLLFTLMTAAFSLHAQSDSTNLKKDSIIGNWSIFSNQAAIQIIEKNGIFEGEIIWLSETAKSKLPTTDINNIEKSKQKQPILNLTCLYGFQYNPTYQIWEKGYFYNPITGETIKATLKMMDNNTIEMTGYAGFSLDFIRETWSRF